MRTLLAVLVLAALASSARAAGENDEDTAVPGLISSGRLVIFYNSEAPLSFVSMTPKDLPKGARELGTVTGVSCQHGLAIPISANLRGTSITGAYGKGGFSKALAEIKKAKPETSGIYDVRTDVRVFSLLGIYRKLCTEVTARAFAGA